MSSSSHHRVWEIRLGEACSQHPCRVCIMQSSCLPYQRWGSFWLGSCVGHLGAEQPLVFLLGKPEGWGGCVPSGVYSEVQFPGHGVHAASDSCSAKPCGRQHACPFNCPPSVRKWNGSFILHFCFLIFLIVVKCESCKLSYFMCAVQEH